MKKKLLAGILFAVMAVTMLPGSMMEKAGVKSEVEAAETLQNPRRVADSSMTAGQKVTYDCVWFGSYPQTEIVDRESTCGTYGKPWVQNTDYIEDSDLYSSLQNATGWDSNGDISISGKKYRRIKQSDATYSTSGDSYYGWNSADVYHYFLYEPIKWRVLSVSDNQAMVISDKALTDQKYNQVSAEVTWKTSTIRSWLNGYGSTINAYGTDYTNRCFINDAFTSSERSAIAQTTLDNKTTGPYSDTHGGDNTTDKIYLLTAYDLYNSNTSTYYGFYKDKPELYDEARRSKSSTYAKAMGVYCDTSTVFLGNCRRWIRSPGAGGKNAGYVDYHGHVYTYGFEVNYFNSGISPVLTLNLSSSNLYNYAGTVCTDGTKNEVAHPYIVTYNANGGTGAPASQTKTKGVDLTLSSTAPNKNGYRFLGWTTSSTSHNPVYQPGDIYSNDEDITLYAAWIKTIEITYDANGGTGAPGVQHGSAFNSDTNYKFVLSKKEPTRDGYEFLGWSTDSNATSATYMPTDTVILVSDLNLYAIWKKTITLTYDANGGDGVPPSQSGTVYNSTTDYVFTIGNIVPLRTDHTFLGWSTSSTAVSASCNVGDTISLSSSTTLYAVWKNESGQGGEPGGDDPVTPEPQPIVKKTPKIKASNCTVPINNPAFNFGATTDGNGKLTYKSSNTKVALITSAGKVTVKGFGKAVITITASATTTYEKAVKKVIITVVPKRMKIKSAKSPKKGKLQVKWVKDKTASGYQLQISKDVRFSVGVFQKNLSSKLVTLKKPVSGLDRKTKYYVRIRAYKKVNGEKLYGIWSYGKMVKIK